MAKRLFAFGISAIALTAAPAFAQNTSAAAEPSAGQAATQSGGNLNEIVVTARRVEERLQDVPIAVSALTAEDLQRQAVEDLTDIAEKTVGFSFEQFAGVQAQPSIRGQQNLRVTSPVQNVATYLNGVYIQRGYFIDQSLLDLERVEIIKGPQSALYGRNAFAGVINLTTRTPDLDEFSGRVSGTVGIYDRYDARAAFNFPLSPGTFAIYGSIAHSEFDGTWRNNHPLADAEGAATRGRVGGYDKDAYQLGAKLRIGDAVTLEGLYVRTERDIETPATYAIATASPILYPFNTLNASPTGVGAARQNRLFVGELPVLPTIVPGETRLPGLVIDPRTFGLRGPSEIWVAKAAIDPGGPINLELIYGRTEASIRVLGNSARDPLYNAVVFGVPYGTIFDASGTESSFTSDSLEARVNFTASDRLSGFVGVNYNSTSDIESNAAQFAPPNSLTPPDPRSLYPVFPGAEVPTSILFRRNTFLERDEDVFAVFGFLSWEATEKLIITLEGRYTDETQKAVDRLATDPPVGTPPRTFLAATPPRLTLRSSYFTPRATATYQITPDNNVYASVARGVKSGGINTLLPTVFVPQRTYDAEQNWTYEIGSKNSFFGGDLQLNLAAYYTDWTNLQTSAVRLQLDGTAPPLGFIVPSVTGNVGDVEVYGVEVEGIWRIVPDLRLNFGASYNRARYKEGVVSQRFGASGNCDGIVCAAVPGPIFPVLPIGGNQLERTPEFDALAGLTYERSFSNDWNFFARADVTYQSKQWVEEANLAYIPDRLLVNASTGLTIGKFDVQLWVKNLFDKKYVTSSLFLIGVNGAGSATYVPFLGDRRTAGLTASLNFLSGAGVVPAAAAQALYDRFAALFEAGDFAGMESLWDEDDPQPFYIAEEHRPLIRDWAGLRDYWRISAQVNGPSRLVWRVEAAKLLADDVLLAMFALDWTIHVRGLAEPYGGSNRGFGVLRRKGDTWRFAAHCEAPLAPITWMKGIYELLGRERAGRT